MRTPDTEEKEGSMLLQEIPISLLVASGALLIYALLGVIQSLRGQGRSGCLSTILMTVTLAGFVIFVVQSAIASDPLSSAARFIALAIVSLLIFVGVILWFLERRGQNATAMLYSRGVFSIGTGVILLVTYFLVPQIPNTILVIPTSTPIVAAVTNPDASNAGNNNIVPTAIAVDVTATPLPTATPTLTRTPLPSPSPTRTRRAYAPPTPTATPQDVAVLENCGATVTTNLNVRAEDTTDAEVVAIVPEGGYVNLTAKNLDGTWWKTDYNGVEGWLFSELLTLDPACSVEVN